MYNERPHRNQVKLILQHALVAAIACALTACSTETSRVEQDLGPIENVVDDIARTVWPGLDRSDGSRYIRHINGFFDEEITGYWFVGFASRITADAFFFCREGETTCPFDADGRFDDSSQVGLPVFARVPGEAAFSPFWMAWVVRVPDDYQPNELKSAYGIESAASAGRVRIEQHYHDFGGAVGPDETIMHCLLVLKGTELERNGTTIVGTDKPMKYVKPRMGWHKQYQVEFYDFTISEGLFPPDPVSDQRPYMPFSDIFVLFRDCKGEQDQIDAACAGDKDKTTECANAKKAKGYVCDHLNNELPGAISERGIETDMTGDGDKSDTNNVIVAFPGVPPASAADPVYSPLWRINVVGVPAASKDKISLIDDTLVQDDSEVRSVKRIRELVTDDILAKPVFMSEAMAGNAIPGNDGKVFFSCPSQVPDE